MMGTLCLLLVNTQRDEYWFSGIFLFIFSSGQALGMVLPTLEVGLSFSVQ